MSQNDRGHDSYILTGKGEILERLRLMERQKTLVTAHPGGQPSGFLTTIVKVLPEKGLLALDASVNDVLNADMLSARSVVFEAKVNGIAARFSAGGVSDATLDGQSVFAVPIPDALYWLQRRAFFRVVLPYAWRIRCRISLTEDTVGEFDVLDVSLRGVAVQDREGRFDPATAVGTCFTRCTLDAPGLKNDLFGLVLRYVVLIPGGEGRRDSWRVGFEFVNFSRSFEIGLQKVVYELEAKRKQADALVRDKR